MPDDIREALDMSGRMGDYEARPHYQRNDYLAWITRAKTPETRRRRLDQMLHELEIGGVYMGMAHGPSAKG